MHGPLHNFGIDFALTPHPRASVSRSAQPTAEGWETLRALLYRGFAAPALPQKPHHFSLNGVPGPDWMESEVLDWSVFAPSLEAVMAVVGMISADLNERRSVHVNCSAGSDRTGFCWGALRLRYFKWTFDKMMTERALFLSAVLVDAVMDLTIVEALREIAGLP